MNADRKPTLAMTDNGLIHLADHGGSEDSADRQPELLVREAGQRGHTDLGWLSSFHSFSFGGYFDQRHLGFRSLRVINDDQIAAGGGFPTHPHRNMEIISYVLDGALQHRDSTGRGGILTPDDIQVMSAGKGITHSEFNPSGDSGNHFLQIWIEPALRGAQPRYQDAKVTAEQKRGVWKRIAGPADSDAAVSIYQDASIFATQLEPGQSLDYVVESSRHVWLQVARGTLVVNGTRLNAGDAVATSRPTALHVLAEQSSEAVLFDLG